MAEPGPEQRPGDPQHRLRRGPLAHADHHRAVADGLHVAALDVGTAPVFADPAEPDGELLGGEHRAEPVDGLHDHGLRLAGRLGHRVDRDPVVDPARRVALEQEVRQRRQQHRRRVGGLPHQPRVPSHVGLGDPADQELGHHRRIRGPDPLGGPLRGGDADLALVQDVPAHPVPGLRAGQRLGQQVLGLEHLDAAVAHRLAEHVMLGLGPRHPQHVVEEQLARRWTGSGGCVPGPAGAPSPGAACPPRSSLRTACLITSLSR